jgi:hypothetical protein
VELCINYFQVITSQRHHITKEGRIQGTSLKTGGLYSVMADGTTTIIAVSTASNGLTKTVNNIKLGGVMTDSTTNIEHLEY